MTVYARKEGVSKKGGNLLYGYRFAGCGPQDLVAPGGLTARQCPGGEHDRSYSTNLRRKNTPDTAR